MNPPGITVFTPTYNREKLLSRAYQSLLKQTDLQFDWVVVDDGSTDGTAAMVKSWIPDSPFPIGFQYKSNGGKYTAMLASKKMLTGNWVMILDSDDELTPDAVEVMKKEITRLEEENTGIVEIRAFCKNPDGTRRSNFHFPEGRPFVDAGWHDMVLKQKNDSEMLSVIRTDVYNKIVTIPEDLWLEGQFKYLSESVFWARINGLTRYINRDLRVYHEDADNSVMRKTNSRIGFTDDIMLSKFFLSENLQHVSKRPGYFVSLAMKYLVAGMVLGIPLTELFQKAEGWRFKLLLIVLLLPATAYYLYGKFVKKRLWRPLPELK